jgi:hypothetical protein
MVDGVPLATTVALAPPKEISHAISSQAAIVAGSCGFATSGP